MEAALKRILTPKTSLDILRDIEQAKAQNRPYTISFIGVNGVGKVMGGWYRQDSMYAKTNNHSPPI